MIGKIKQEINSFSHWFRVLFFLTLAIYLVLWFFTIYLSGIQKEKSLEPVLPILAEDSKEYSDLAESMLSGNGFTIDGEIETNRVPGYPAVIVFFYKLSGSYFVVTLFQIILVFSSAIIIRRIGILFSSQTVGEVAATLLLINPVTITLSLLILTDVLFLFLFVLGFYKILLLTEEKLIQKTLVISALFVFAIYTRAMGLFALPIFIVPFLATKISNKLKLKSIAIMILFIIISISPWVWRNYVTTGVADFNSFKSVNLSWSVPRFLAKMHGKTLAEEAIEYHKATGVPEELWQSLVWRNLRYSKQISAVGQKAILENPFAYLKYHTVTSIPFLFPSSILFMRDAYDSAMHQKPPFSMGIIDALNNGDFKTFFTGLTSVWWKFAERLLWLFGLVIAGFVIWNRSTRVSFSTRQGKLVLIFVFITLYLMLLSGPTAGPRLSFQVWPFLFILFASGVVYLKEKFK